MKTVYKYDPVTQAPMPIGYVLPDGTFAVPADELPAGTIVDDPVHDDLRLIEGLLTDIKNLLNSSCGAVDAHSLACSESVDRLRAAWTKGEIPQLQYIWARYFRL